MDPYAVLPNRQEIAFEEGETSSAIISKNDYEVFLSFRGPDTRQGFTDCLYHALIDSGIVVFRDDDELALGDKIDEILTALDNSKICIVVLSPKFAESAWCLREVEKMVGMKKDIVPIFYCVTPDDVKLKTGLYVGDLMVHEAKHGKERVQQWREALKEIPTIKGRELNNTGFIEFSKQIAKELLTKLKVNHKLEIDNFVDVPDEVEAALKLLDIESGDCRFVSIHGMGGIGKTTLAKVIFNQIFDKFDCSCFLENIRDNVSQGGLQKLQEELLRSLDPSLRDATQIFGAMWKIKNNFTRKKVLIVLDDIDHKNHIRDLVGSFGSGSRIIFTTRNAELHEKGTSSDAYFSGLEKKVMDSKVALKLFSRHAFGEDSPPKDFESLSTEAISTTGRLPLALEVVGSLLRRRSAKFWKDVIEKLKKAPHQDVQEKLKISYDVLDAEQQEIFLDIACFFIGVEKTNAVYMWEACDFYPNNGIEALISMSLIKVNENECFWMHDQLRDLGRAIVKVNSKDARAGTRLWMPKDALELLKRNVGKDKVEALHLDGRSNSLDRENFVGLEKLRFLRICANFGGDLGGLIPKLRWLSLIVASSFNITNLCLRELVVLELSCSFDEETISLYMLFKLKLLSDSTQLNSLPFTFLQISKQLKVLTLSRCDELISTPDVSKIVNLERLVLERCENLTSIHSIGELVKLKHLSLRGCEDLRVLPDSIGDLRLLISLDLWGSVISELPRTIGGLTKLESLCLECCNNLQRLPDSIGNLHSLIHLDMSYSSIAELPHSFGNLHSLIDLDMTYSSITELPSSFGNLASLQKLRLWGLRIRSLPVSFRGLQKLERLDIGGSNSDERYWIRKLRGLPKGLTCLHIGGVKKIQNLSNLINLSHLVVQDSPSLLVLEGIQHLIKLKLLSIKSSGVRSLSTEWGALKQLKSLTLQCPSLEFGQCQLPCSLESLDLDVNRWGQLPINLSTLKKLSKLKLGNFVIEKADTVEGLESLEDLEMWGCFLKFNDFPVLKSLRNLILKRCRSQMGASPPVVDEEIIGPELHIKLSNLKNLSELRLSADCIGSRSKLQIELFNLKNLSKLDLIDLSIHDDGFKVEEVCESLVDLKMYDCNIFEFANIVSVLKNLTSLSIARCSFPTMTTCLHIPPQLDRLVKLDFEGCTAVVDIQGIGKLKSLTTLRISWCNSLRTIGDLFELKGPVSIDITYCYNFEGIEGLDRLLSTGTLSHLNIRGFKCKYVEYAENDSEDD